jgi:predicted dehydrogenase
MPTETRLTRRDFVRTTTAAVAAMAVPALAQDAPPIRIGLVGCGGRGTGAAHDCLTAAPGVKLVAMADMFADRLAGSRNWLKSKGYEVADDKCFTGFDAYKRLLDCDVDLVLNATPPGFRPIHVEACVAAGKHVFMEKPIAVDPAGVRRVLAAGAKAREQGTGMLAGTQYRHAPRWMQTIAEMHGGRIGDVRAARAYYNIGTLWHRGSKKEWTRMEQQLRNWYYYCWLSGDHIVEQHIHGIDVTNWGLKSHPVRATAVGGRQVRTDPKFGNIYDHFCVDYEYPDGVHVMSMCRQMKDCANHVGVYFHGTEGVASPYRGTITGANPWRFKAKEPNMYVQEHADYLASIRAGEPLNETEHVCESTLTAIMGREAAYTGKSIEWDALLKADLDLAPAKYEFGDLAMRPVPMPGQARG